MVYWHFVNTRNVSISGVRANPFAWSEGQVKIMTEIVWINREKKSSKYPLEIYILIPRTYDPEISK